MPQLHPKTQTQATSLAFLPTISPLRCSKHFSEGILMHFSFFFLSLSSSQASLIRWLSWNYNLFISFLLGRHMRTSQGRDWLVQTVNFSQTARSPISSLWFSPWVNTVPGGHSSSSGHPAPWPAQWGKQGLEASQGVTSPVGSLSIHTSS